MGTHRVLTRLVLALLFSLLTCWKPLLGDEAVYYRFAAHIASSPLDPYGFSLGGVPANHVLAPPVLLYWWALAIRLFGMQPLLWKLWLLPFSLLLVFALDSLLRRFCRGLETPLLWLSVLSPTLLPSFNLFLDVPALALSLAAVALFLHGSERGSFALTSLAGLIAGLAMETKYTGFVTPAIFVLHGFLFRSRRLGLLAAALALGTFAGWECATSQLYGESHFLHSLRGQAHSLSRPFHLVLPLVRTVGGVAPAVALLGLAGWGASRRAILSCGAVFALGYVLAACWDADGTALLPPWARTLPRLAFSGFGLAVCAAAALAGRRLVRGTSEPARVVGHGQETMPQRRGLGQETKPQRGSRIEWFLVLWLALELAGYFALSPFPAVRRVLGLVVVGTLVAGRWAAINCQLPPRRALINGIALGNMVLALVLLAVDVRDVAADRTAVWQTAPLLRCKPPDATAWFVVETWCGFEFYAEQAGLRRFGVPGDSPPRPGDWIVVMYRPAWERGALVSYAWGEVVGQVEVRDSLPLRTVPCYYAGRAALEHHRGPRAVVDVYRLR